MIMRLSIITPVYNVKRFIEFCINNVLEQGCPGVEHVIVDGGSTDGTAEIIERFARRYEHIKWVSEKDRGQADAMNKGIRMSGGSILGILNADDYYERNALRDVLDIFKDLPEPSLVVGNCRIWDDKGTVPGINKPRYLGREQLLTADEKRFPFPVNPSAYFYHKTLHDIIGMYDTNEHHVMDLEFILKAVSHAKPYYVDTVFGNFRLIEGTKTFEDMKSGTGRSRFKKLIKEYRKDLTFRDKLKIWYYQTFGKIIYSALKKCND